MRASVGYHLNNAKSELFKNTCCPDIVPAKGEAADFRKCDYDAAPRDQPT